MWSQWDHRSGDATFLKYEKATPLGASRTEGCRPTLPQCNLPLHRDWCMLGKLYLTLSPNTPEHLKGVLKISFKSNDPFLYNADGNIHCFPQSCVMRDKGERHALSYAGTTFSNLWTTLVPERHNGAHCLTILRKSYDLFSNEYLMQVQCRNPHWRILGWIGKTIRAVTRAHILFHASGPYQY